MGCLKVRNSPEPILAGLRRCAALAAILMLALPVTGCESIGRVFKDDTPPPLPGERLSVLQLEQSLEPDPDLAGLEVTVPEPFRNSQWPQAGGYPDHNMGHVALGPLLQEAWRADAGQGSSGAQRLVARPVAAEGVVYTLDADARVFAFDIRTGDRLWETDTRPENESTDALTGGIAVAEGRVFVTTGYASVVALDAASGQEIWRQRTSAPSRAAPTVAQGRVFVVTIENKLLTLDAATGTVQWDHAGLSETAGLLGAASPATNGTVLVVGYSSGEIYGLRPENGQSVWQDSLAAIRKIGMMASMADIRALPVISDNQVFAISHASRFLALDARNGLRIWQHTIGGTTTPVVAGNFIFVLTNENELVAMTRQDGRIRWSTALPRFEDEEDREDPITWTSPLLAGGRLILAGSNGEILEFDIKEGELERRWDARGPVMVDPLIVDDVLLVLDESARLTAYR
jgi:outer membrane protein assembly factor BamB